LGGLDILINNAGITSDALIMRMKPESFENVIAVNLTGAFYMLKELSALMLKQRAGRIVNLSSVSGIKGNAGQANYSASKAGLIGLTLSAAKELGGRGITVNAIAPGLIDTDMAKALSETQRENVVAQIAAGRLGAPEEVAALVCFLCSEQAAYITGQVVAIDGGLIM
jgi:3-oxoacyl-[acyl-carrier protein] reductase